jgi:hypothetical protein
LVTSSIGNGLTSPEDKLTHTHTPLLINLLPHLFIFFHRQEAHGWRQDGKNVDFLGGRHNKGKAQMTRWENGGGALEESVTKIVTF